MRLLLFLIIVGCCPPLFAGEPVVIVHGDDNWAPNEFRRTDGKLVGIHIDLIRLAAAELGVEVRFVAVPWQRALNMMKNGEADAISYAGYSEERAKYLLYIPGNIINQTQTRYVHRAGEDFADISSEFRKHKLGIIRGYDFGKNFDQRQFGEVVEASREDQLVDMLLGGRVDAILLNFRRLRYQMKGDKRLMQIAVSDQVVLQHDIYLGFARKRNRHIYARRFAKVIPSIRRSVEYRQMISRYFHPVTAMPVVGDH